MNFRKDKLAALASGRTSENHKQTAAHLETKLAPSKADQVTDPESSYKTDSSSQISRSFSAIFGDAARVMMSSEAHMHYTLQDLNWRLLPALKLKQFTILFGQQKNNSNVPLPLGLALWAKVSTDVDNKLKDDSAASMKLEREDWNSGSIPWLIDLVGPDDVIPFLLNQISNEVFKGQEFKMKIRDKDGNQSVKTIKSVSLEQRAHTKTQE